MTATKMDTWIKAGYELLGAEGMDGLKVERLARQLHLNKSGFYYYFGSMESFVKALLKHHNRLAQDLTPEISACETIDPDFLRLIVKRKAFFLVESQLLVKSRPQIAFEGFDDAAKIMDRQFLRLWHTESGLFLDAALTWPCLNILRHYFYSRLAPEKMTYKYLHAVALEIRLALENLTAANLLHNSVSRIESPPT